MQNDVNAPTVTRTGNLVSDAAEFILDQARAVLRERPLFRIGLSGGETPRAVYARVAETGADIDWARVQFSFGDERCVPPDDAASNYRMARESLFDHLPLPPGNVFRMRGEIDPAHAAAEYEEQLAAFAARLGERRYRHDLLLLGLGEDGHTASLFPGSPALDEAARLVVPTTGPKPPPQRITFTYPLINAARHVCFITKTRGKEHVLESVLAGNRQFPAARVQPEEGAVSWLIAL